MRYSNNNVIVDDIPLLSQWIKKELSKGLVLFGCGGGI